MAAIGICPLAAMSGRPAMASFVTERDPGSGMDASGNRLVRSGLAAATVGAGSDADGESSSPGVVEVYRTCRCADVPFIPAIDFQGPLEWHAVGTGVAGHDAGPAQAAQSRRRNLPTTSTRAIRERRRLAPYSRSGRLTALALHRRGTAGGARRRPERLDVSDAQS